MENGKILVTTIGRPTSDKVVKSKVQTINRYNINKVLGILPEGDRKEDSVYNNIVKGWSDDKLNIKNNVDVKLDEIKINLDIFYEKISDKKDEKKLILVKNEQILLVAERIIELIDESTTGIVFDVASGRRIMSPICISVAYFLKDIGTIKDNSKGSKFEYLKKVVDNIKIITRPTVTFRDTLDEKKDEKGNIVPSTHVNAKKQYAKFHELDLIKFPVFNERQIRILNLWNNYDTHKSLAEAYLEYQYEKLKGIDSILKNCKELQKILDKHHFINSEEKKKHPLLNPYGLKLVDIYNLLF